MTDPHFDYLTATIKVTGDAPKQWREKGLGDFYLNPNHEDWSSFARVLYHESIHFWQTLSSGYVANLVGGDWSRLLHFEKTGEVQPHDQFLTDYAKRQHGCPFSPREMVECWARYWDVHTRNPATVLAEEGLSTEAVSRWMITDPMTGQEAYRGEAYDYVMTGGNDPTGYETPYRWTLEKCEGNSPFAAVCFPILAHAAFGSRDPVGLYCKAIERAWQLDEVREAISFGSGNINLDWLNHWDALHGLVVRPLISELRLPSFTPGFDVIYRGILGTHPIYGRLVQQSRVLAGHLKILKRTHANGPPPMDPAKLFLYATADMPSRDRWVVFGLPGQPLYRYHLGRSLPPARVRFSNFAYVAHRPIQEKLAAAEGQGRISGDTLEVEIADLEKRVERFRAAEYAVELGLAPNAFERSGTGRS